MYGSEDSYAWKKKKTAPKNGTKNRWILCKNRVPLSYVEKSFEVQRKIPTRRRTTTSVGQDQKLCVRCLRHSLRRQD